MKNEGIAARQGKQAVIEEEAGDLLSAKGTRRMAEQYQKAYVNKQLLNQLLTRVAYQTGSRPITNIKNPETTIKKVAEKRLDNPNEPYDLEDVGDLSRGRLIFRDESELKKAVGTLKSVAKGYGIKVIKEEDMFKNPDPEAKETGYKGYHVDLEMPNGQHNEVQLHTLNSYAAAMLTHVIHESYGDDVPKTAAQEAKVASDHVMKMDPVQADYLAQRLESAAAPQVALGEQKAIQTMLGQKQVPHAEPLQAQPGGWQEAIGGQNGL